MLFVRCRSGSGFCELIDTLWNVNCFINCLICRCIGINRYIMECKSAIYLSTCNPSCRINRYIMECKCNFFILFRCNPAELIDTLWNVNEGRSIFERRNDWN